MHSLHWGVDLSPQRWPGRCRGIVTVLRSEPDYTGELTFEYTNHSRLPNSDVEGATPRTAVAGPRRVRRGPGATGDGPGRCPGHRQDPAVEWMAAVRNCPDSGKCGRRSTRLPAEPDVGCVRRGAYDGLFAGPTPAAVAELDLGDHRSVAGAAGGEGLAQPSPGQARPGQARWLPSRPMSRPGQDVGISGAGGAANSCQSCAL